MQLEKNMYVRTKDGTIERIIELGYQDKEYVSFSKDNEHLTYKNKIKASHNIIDLIEVGDYVNGNKIIKISTDFCGRNILIYGYDDGDRQVAITIYEDGIKSIVTKEQFESMSYKVGD